MSDTRKRALLVGAAQLLGHLPPLLHRVGMDVHTATVKSPYFRTPRRRGTASLYSSLSSAVHGAVAAARSTDYDLIVVADDHALRLLRDDPRITTSDKVRLAPVTGAPHLTHLGSKLGVAKVLSDTSVNYPDWCEVASPTEVIRSAERLGWPLLLKRDLGAGGRSVRLVANAAAAWQVFASLPDHPAVGRIADAATREDMKRVIAQRVVQGRLVDLSGYFHDGQLIHFTYSRMLAPITPFGASSLRELIPTCHVDPEVVTELNTIGSALGLTGFTNVSAIETPNGQRHYFEVDARPNLWTHLGRTVGDDPVVRLRRWFREGLVDLSPTTRSPLRPQRIRMMHRTSRRHLLLNTDSALTSAPWGTPDCALVLASTMLKGVRNAPGYTVG